MSGFFESHFWEIRAAQCVTNNIIFDGFLRLWDDSQLVNDHICIIFWLRELLNSRWRDFFLVRTKQTRILQLCRTTFVCQSISAAPRFFIIRPFCHTNAASIIWILHLAVFIVSHFDHFRGSGVYTLCLSVTFSITPPTKGVKNINASC